MSGARGAGANANRREIRGDAAGGNAVRGDVLRADPMRSGAFGGDAVRGDPAGLTGLIELPTYTVAFRIGSDGDRWHGPSHATFPAKPWPRPGTADPSSSPS